jgi:peptide/nickel transport system permease protein
MARTALDVMGKWGARIGMVWILAVAFMAIFAPLLANSHPYLIKTADGWSSPLLNFLTAVDVVLLLSAGAAVAMACCWRVRGGSRFAMWLWLTAWAIPFIGWAEWWRRFEETQRGAAKAILITIAVVTLLTVAGVVIAVMWRSTASWIVKSIVLLAGLLIAVGGIAFPVQPSSSVVFSQYREGLASGEIAVAYTAPIAYSPTDRLRDRPDQRLVEPGWRTWFRFSPDEADSKKQYFYVLGTTSSGEDVASRMIHASRIALAVGFIATGIAVVIGVIVGGLMGYFAGWVDLLGWRLVEIFSAIPSLILLIAFTAFYGRNLYLIMVIIGLTGWVGYAVFVRAEFLRLRQQDYVVAARAAGLPLWSILFRHMLPNGVTPVIVNASFGVASAILMESTLSFLGLGLVEEPSWGQMLDQIRGLGGGFAWWMAIFPGLAIFLTVFAYNLVGEALRDAIDPRLQARV